MPGTKGNQNNRKGTDWAKALRFALDDYEEGKVARGLALRAIGKKVVEMALDGDMQAIKEVGDRLDGKPHQSISGVDDGPIEASIRVVFGRD